MKFVIVLSCLLVPALAVPNKGRERIVKGTDAAEGQFPSTVSLRYYGMHQCGASILDEFTILSAAHCVDTFDVNKMTIKLGNVKLTEQTETYEVASFVRHADYNRENAPYEILNDVSILKLKSPIVFRDGVQPIKLRQTNIGEEDVILSGWGTTIHLGDVPDKLQFADLKTLSTMHCNKTIEDWNITDDVLCAHGRTDQGACHGDSGSPLVDLNGEQVGIDSWAMMPCASGYPDVYMRIYSFLDWIEENRH